MRGGRLAVICLIGMFSSDDIRQGTPAVLAILQSVGVILTRLARVEALSIAENERE
jgi:hypothetical protein